MSFAHHGTPGSVPTDYGIISRYGSGAQPHIEGEQGEPGTSTARPRRRSSVSFPTTDLARPSKPTMAWMSERTPLLGHEPADVPTIDESVDDSEEHEHAAFMVMFWEELQILSRYTFPVWITHSLEYSFVIASVVSLGHISTTALAASTLGSMTLSVVSLSVIQGFASALDTVLPSAWTSGAPQLVGLWSQRMTVVMAFTLVPMFMILLNAESILLFLKQDPEVAALAAVYLKWECLGIPAYAFNCVSRRYFQSQGLFDVPTRIIAIVAPVNALLNWLLVWGPAPIRLGFIGAPIATAISFNMVALASIVYGVFYVPKTAWHPIGRRSFTSLGVLVSLGLAGVASTASEWWSWELVGLATSLLGPVPLATQSVLLVSASTSYQAPFALGVATSVRIGNLLGEGHATRSAVVTRVSLFMSLAISLLLSTMFLVFRKKWALLFNDDPAVVTMVASVLPLVALFQVVDGATAVTGGIFRARGKQFTAALLNLSAYYVIGIPFGIWLAFKCDMGILGLWLGLTLALVYSAAIGVWMCLRTDWDHEVQKVTHRIAQDAKRQRREDEEAQA